MKEEKEIYVYFEDEEGRYVDIPEKYLENPETMQKWGSWDDLLDSSGKVTIYKLVPHKVFKKEINYKFV